VPENSSSDMHLELETPVHEYISLGIETSTSRVKEHHTIATDRPRHIITPPARYDYEDLVFMHLSLATEILLLFKRLSIAKRIADGPHLADMFVANDKSS
jgi:hypothetical protein